MNERDSLQASGPATSVIPISRFEVRLIAEHWTRTTIALERDWLESGSDSPLASDAAGHPMSRLKALENAGLMSAVELDVLARHERAKAGLDRYVERDESGAVVRKPTFAEVERTSRPLRSADLLSVTSMGERQHRLRERANRAMGDVDRRVSGPPQLPVEMLPPVEPWQLRDLPVDDLLAHFPGLRIRAGFKFVSYGRFLPRLHRSQILLYALPTESTARPPQQCMVTLEGDDDFPRPTAACRYFMDGIDGDGTPQSFWSASIFARVIADLGCPEGALSWRSHWLIGNDPGSDVSAGTKRTSAACTDPLTLPEPFGHECTWTWTEQRPATWSPSVYLDKSNGCTFVTFCSWYGVCPMAVHRHLDRFTPGSYRFEQCGRDIGYGPGDFARHHRPRPIDWPCP